VFESFRTGKRLVWKKDLETGHETELIATPSDEALPRIAADGHLVAYSIANYEKHFAAPMPDIYTVPFTGGQPRKVCGECGFLWSLSPDSATVLYGDESAMSALDLNSGKSHRILDEPGHGFWDGKLSADRRWIAFTAASGPADALQYANFVAPFLSRELRIPKTNWVRISQGPEGNNLEWSPSGALVYGSAPLDGSICLWASRLNPETKRPVGAPQPVSHFHRARLSLIDDPAWRGVSVARDKIVFTLREFKGNLWTATPPQQRN
jgi:hypothetical protein